MRQCASVSARAPGHLRGVFVNLRKLQAARHAEHASRCPAFTTFTASPSRHSSNPIQDTTPCTWLTKSLPVTMNHYQSLVSPRPFPPARRLFAPQHHPKPSQAAWGASQLNPNSRLITTKTWDESIHLQMYPALLMSLAYRQLTQHPPKKFYSLGASCPSTRSKAATSSVTAMPRRLQQPSPLSPAEQGTAAEVEHANAHLCFQENNFFRTCQAHLALQGSSVQIQIFYTLFGVKRQSSRAALQWPSCSCIETGGWRPVKCAATRHRGSGSQSCPKQGSDGHHAHQAISTALFCTR